ncbi:hypothetical protein C8R45DRAFT_502068 [Mycena sanguinolenta]|nr:hypothetical protein C8R45DRAFT_502068 [Mycena sanguinolenta]
MSHDDDWGEILGDDDPASQIRTALEFLQRVDAQYDIVDKDGATFLQAMTSVSEDQLITRSRFTLLEPGSQSSSETDVIASSSTGTGMPVTSEGQALAPSVPVGGNSGREETIGQMNNMGGGMLLPPQPNEQPADQIRDMQHYSTALPKVPRPQQFQGNMMQSLQESSASREGPHVLHSPDAPLDATMSARRKKAIIPAAGLPSDSPIQKNPLNQAVSGSDSFYQRCSALRARLMQIRSFPFYFSLVTPDNRQSTDPVTQLWDLFSFGIPLCYIFDQLPEDQGFNKINHSEFDQEKYDANPDRAKKHAIACFAMQIGTEKVTQKIPGCELFTVTEIWDRTSTDGLVKVIKTVTAIVNHLPPDAFETSPFSPAFMTSQNSSDFLASGNTVQQRVSEHSMSKVPQSTNPRAGLQGYPQYDGFEFDDDEDDYEDYSPSPYNSQSGLQSSRAPPLGSRRLNAQSMPPERDAIPGYNGPRPRTQDFNGSVVAQWRNNVFPPFNHAASRQPKSLPLFSSRFSSTKPKPAYNTDNYRPGGQWNPRSNTNKWESGSSLSMGDSSSSEYSPNSSSLTTPESSSNENMRAPPLKGNEMDKFPPVKMKVHFNEDIFVMLVPRMTEHAELVDKLERKIRLCGPRRDNGPLRIKYKDEDGDMISLSSTEDVKVAFEQYQPGGQVTLYVA